MVPHGFAALLIITDNILLSFWLDYACISAVQTLDKTGPEGVIDAEVFERLFPGSLRTSTSQPSLKGSKLHTLLVTIY